MITHHYRNYNLRRTKQLDVTVHLCGIEPLDITV